MTGLRSVAAAALLAAVTIMWAAPAASAPTEERKARQTLFIGVDTSGSFKGAGYDDALTFLAYYIYGHLNEAGGLALTRDLFVAAIGGKSDLEPKGFHPVHDFQNKSVERIEADLRGWFPATDTLTDFNAFFQQVARITKERGLVLTPMTVMIISDGVPDVLDPKVKSGSPETYRQIDLSMLEFLSRNVTVRLAYASPRVGEQWRKLVKRDRVRFWAVERDVMAGWRAQVTAGAEPLRQHRLWKWVKDNVDYRVRRGV
jgi:hypothetical protein